MKGEEFLTWIRVQTLGHYPRQLAMKAASGNCSWVQRPRAPEMSLWRNEGLREVHRWVFIPVSEAHPARDAEDQTSGGKRNSTSFPYGEDSLELSQGLPWCCPRVALWAEPCHSSHSRSCSLRSWVTWASGGGTESQMVLHLGEHTCNVHCDLKPMSGPSSLPFTHHSAEPA